MVWDGAVLGIDGRPAAAVPFAQTSVTGDIIVSGGIWGSRVTLTPPAGAACRVNWPLDILRTYMQLFDKEPFDPPFRIAMVCAQWENPAPEGSAEFRISI